MIQNHEPFIKQNRSHFHVLGSNSENQCDQKFDFLLFSVFYSITLCNTHMNSIFRKSNVVHMSSTFPNMNDICNKTHNKPNFRIFGSM